MRPIRNNETTNNNDQLSILVIELVSLASKIPYTVLFLLFELRHHLVVGGGNHTPWTRTAIEPPNKDPPTTSAGKCLLS